MRLRGIDFGPVMDASGVRGFFGEGWPHHRWLGPLGPRFDGSTFVSKTFTLYRVKGFMAFGEDGITPAETFPRCIVVRFCRQGILNAVAWSNPGAPRLLEDGRWQDRREPFMLSVGARLERREDRLPEFANLMEILAAHRPQFGAPFGLQINLTCPNVDTCGYEIFDEAVDFLSIAAYYLPGVPLMPKLSVLTPIEMAVELSGHPNCDALCVTNSIPYGSFADRIDWRRIFGPRNPLELFGGGAYSGPDLLPLVVDWLMRARAAGLVRPINAGGGIIGIDGAHALFEAGADSIFIGATASILRPWRVRKIIRAVRHWHGIK